MVSGGFDVVDFMLFCIAAVLSPPVISRRFGGYRIVPKACNTTDESTGVCMFNNDCTKINGTVAGSCTDGFLFGSCCKLTEGSYYISVPLSLNPLTSSEGLVIPETISTTNKVNVPSNIEDTVLLHHDGTVVQSPYKPVDFIFNSRPDLFLSNGSYEDPLGDKYLSAIITTEKPATNPKPTESWYVTKDSTKPNKYTTMNSIYKSSTKFILSSPGLYNPTTESSQYDDYNGNYVSQHQTNYQGIKDVTNQASIYHILNILNETDPVAPDKTSSTTHESHYPSTITRYPATVTRYPVAVTTRYNSTYSSNYYTTRKPFVTVKPTSKPCKPSIYSPTSYPNKHNLLVLNNKGCPPDDQDVTIGQNTNNKHKPQIIINTTPQITVDPHKIVTTTKYNKTHKPYPTINYNKYTTSKPTTHYFNYLTATTKPPKRPQYSSPQSDYNKKKNTTHYVHLTGIQVTSEVNVTPKPGESGNVVYDPIPTVILLEHPNTTPKPTKTAITIQTPQNSIISVNSNGNVATYRPPSTTYAGSQTPMYTASPSPSYGGGGISSSPGISNYVRPVTEQLGPMYTVVNSNPEQYNPISTVPLFEPVGTILTTPTQVLKITPSNSSEILVAFPPDRDPSANISYLRPDPEIVSWVSPKPDDTLELIEDDNNGIVIEDDKFDSKVHSFVEKIVQNLQGNFVDLENVLIDGQANATVTPTKKPSSKPSKPPKKPTKKPTTLVTVANLTRPLITKPPPRPVSSTQRPVKVTETVVTIKPTKPVTEGPTVLSDSEEYTPERINKECGIRPLMKNGRIVGGKGATFGEWPWQVLVREATWLGLFTKNKCGGVLITNRYVVTAAHCQPGFLASLIAVFGEYDISGEIESRRSVSRNVRRVIVHRYYNAATFENDVSLLELESPVQFDKHIIPICMPQDGDDFTGKVATVTGWGRLKYGGGVPSVLQEVHVPVIDNNVCQEMFHTAGHSKTILSSFICAGYANGQRDSCEGDSGGPLMVEREDGHWVLAGTVSHGIKCAAPYLPGVYMRTTYYKPWIATITGVKNL